MKISKYTFMFDENGQEYYVYNTLSNALMEIDKESYSLLFESRNTQKTKKLPPADFDEDLWEALCINNIISDNDTDDYLKYKASITNIRKQRTGMHLTLAPTMDCCFRCHYCFEKYKEKKYMTPEIMDQIIKYVTSYPELKNIKITWFGGEPLMAGRLIGEFYDKFRDIWQEPFISNIITTGYHIDKESIRVMQKVGISSVQITLDGMKETHNKVKHLPSGEDVFERILSNIELLNDSAPEINITIRVNLTLENKEEYIPLHKLCLTRFYGRSNITISPAFVLDRGTGDICRSNNNIFFGHIERSKFILNLAKNGINSVFVRYPEPFFNECAIRNEMAIAFDPEGYAYKCWEVIGNKEYAIGKLNDDGILTDINQTILNRQLYGADTFDDPICSQCKYLPICNGGCPIQRIENKFEGGHNDCCSHYKGFMPDFLKIHIARKKAQEAAATEKQQ